MKIDVVFFGASVVKLGASVTLFDCFSCVFLMSELQAEKFIIHHFTLLQEDGLERALNSH